MTRAGEQPKEPTRASPAPVQARILDAAVALFAEKGFDGTSVQEIVDAAQVTKGALYHYFASKDDLLYEIYHSLISRQLDGMERILAQGLDPAGTVRALIHDLVETTAERAHAAAVFGREMHQLRSDHGAAVRADRRRYHATFRELIERAQEEGTFSTVASADMVTFTVFGVINQMPTWYRPDGPKTPARIAEELADFVLAALRPETG